MNVSLYIWPHWSICLTSYKVLGWQVYSHFVVSN